ncbi:MAG: hypothetical protein IJS13_09640 [Paludibacteraceae bacterium]|nr:hypothetical protein [Paludibacteraceae bacterium]
MAADNWILYQNALVWHGSIGEESPTRDDAKMAVRSKKAMFARWTSDFDTTTVNEWWYCLCDSFTPLSELKSKQRYRIKRGLGNCRVERLHKGVIKEYVERFFEIAEDCFADYPDKYRPKPNKEEFCNHLCQLVDTDFWICRNVTDNEIIGYGYCRRKGVDVFLEQVKIPTRYLNTEANAALAYSMVEYYLHNLHFRYLVDGERNIKHETNYQAFLVQVIGFRYVFCKLNVEYAPMMAIAVKMLFPFKNVIEYMGRKSRFFYNVYCVLKQEEICRKCLL